MKKLIFTIAALTMIFASGCGKSNKGSNLNGNGYYGNGGGYGNGGPAGSTGAVGADSYGRFTLGIRLGGVNTGPIPQNNIGGGGTIRITQPLGCMSPQFGNVGLPPGGNLNLSMVQPGQVTPYGQIYGLLLGANAANGLAVEVVVQNATIQALPTGVNTCLGGTSNELFGMVSVIFRVNGQVACQVPAYVDLQSAGGGC